MLLQFNEEILKSSFPDVLKSIIYLVNPPTDLFIPIASEKIIESNLPHVTVSFENKYFGKHTIDVIVSESKTNSELEELQSEINSKIECSVGGKKIFSMFTYSRSIFISEHGKGFTLFTYDVPKDMPSDKKVICSVNLGENYHNKFTHLYIKKASDL